VSCENTKDGIAIATDVLAGDQATEPIDALFAQSVAGGGFALSADTGASGIDSASLVYDFEATAGHGIIAGDEILLLEPPHSRSFYAEVVSVATNTITLDRPIDHDFTAADTLGRIVTTNMAVDGSVTPQIFSIRAGFTETDIVRFIITIIGDGPMDDGKFGNLAKLTRGLTLRIYDGFQKTILNFKTNGEIKQFCFDGTYTPGTLGPSGAEGFSARITYGGQSKHGVVLRIGTDDVIQLVVQDDLTGLVSLKASAQGHEVTKT
jgi:hypothetical protein